MSIEEFVGLLVSRCRVLDSGARMEAGPGGGLGVAEPHVLEVDIRVAFSRSVLTVTNPCGVLAREGKDSNLTLDFVGFLEALGRVAEVWFIPEMDPCTNEELGAVSIARTRRPRATRLVQKIAPLLMTLFRESSREAHDESRGDEKAAKAWTRWLGEIPARVDQWEGKEGVERVCKLVEGFGYEADRFRRYEMYRGRISGRWTVLSCRRNRPSPTHPPTTIQCADG